MAFDEFLEDFFDEEQHGETATWTPASGDAKSIAGIFNHEFSENSLGTAGAESTTPIFVCQASKVPNIAQGDTLTINSQNYSVRQVEPDGQGVVALVLEKSS